MLCRVWLAWHAVGREFCPGGQGTDEALGAACDEHAADESTIGKTLSGTQASRDQNGATGSGTASEGSQLVESFKEADQTGPDTDSVGVPLADTTYSAQPGSGVQYEQGLRKVAPPQKADTKQVGCCSVLMTPRLIVIPFMWPCSTLHRLKWMPWRCTSSTP